MKTLVHYDHVRKEVIVQNIQDNEEPALYLRSKEEGGDDDPDPYWHVVGGKWKVIDTTN